MRGFILLLAACPVNALCQYPSLTQHKLSGITSTTFQYKGCFLNSDCYDKQKKSVTEVPPWVVNGSQRTYFFVDGRQTVLWSTPKSLTTNSVIDLKNYGSGPDVATRPYILEPYYSPDKNRFDWRRNYHAIFTAQVLHHQKAGNVTLGFCHSENKNEVSGDCHEGKWTTNTIQAATPINCSDLLTYSGGKPYRDGWKAYNGLLNAVWTPNNAQANWGHQYFPHDLGPVAWPATGYVTPEGIKCTSGLRHPSSILRGDSVYIFFVDGGPYGNNIPHEEGRRGGVKVVRVHKNEALDPHAYYIYYKDPQGKVHWNPSLPEGFTKEKMMDYVAVKGPRSTTLVNDTGVFIQVIRFSVARIKNTDTYVGVEQYIDLSDRNARGGPTWKLALRVSTDLLTWSDRHRVIYKVDDWHESRMNYPVLLNKEGTSNTEVDLDEFYVVGTGSGPSDRVNKIRVYNPSLRLRPGSGPASLMLMAPSAIVAMPDVEVLPFPNPFEDALNVRIKVPVGSRVRLSLITLEGRRIKQLTDTISAATFNASFDLSDCRAGFYLLECLIGEVRVYRKVVKQ